MPKKPIKPNRVRTPFEWRTAQFLLFGSLAIFAIAMTRGSAIVRGITGINLEFWMVLIAALCPFLIAMGYTIHVSQKWKRLIHRTNGLLCPNCAYTLSGCEDNGGGITCPECGHQTESASTLEARWRSAWKSRFHSPNEGIEMRPDRRDPFS